VSDESWKLAAQEHHFRLKTRNKQEAVILFNTRNEEHREPGVGYS
jgi:hypothetical protein